jgi:hypothetical protein
VWSKLLVKNQFLSSTQRSLFASLLLGGLCLGPGCTSGDMGTVTGTVQADGKPVPKALVTFFPQPEGRASSGMTDENGHYELVYSRSENGAEVGEHIVRITTAVEGGDYGDTMAKETIPAKYNVNSELVEQVSPGRNDINFDLVLDGRIVQPGY